MGVKAHAWWLKYGSRVVTGLGITGFIASAGLTGWATYMSVRKVESKTIELGRPLTKKEVFKNCWKFYIPSVLIGTTSAGCLIGASVNSAKVNASLAEAYATSQASLIAMRQQVAEAVGEKKAAMIQQELIADKMASVPSPVSQAFIMTGTEPTLFFDEYSKRYFKSTMEKVKRAELEIDRRLMDEIGVPLNEWYFTLNAKGLDPLPAGAGTNYGFVCHGIKHTMDIRYGTKLVDDESQACITLSYDVEYLDWDTIHKGDGS